MHGRAGELAHLSKRSQFPRDAVNIKTHGSAKRKSGLWLFLGRCGKPITTRQYTRLLDHWLTEIGLEPALFGSHSLRRTKATLIYRRTGNLRAVQLLLGHTKIESTVRYLGVEADDAFAIAEQIDV